jgi:uncharacterized DUF497 family protein
MRITFDPAKRSLTLKGRGLDFRDARRVFDSPSLDVPDDRADYGESRIRTVGYLEGRMVMVVWTPRGRARRVISMRWCNDSEKKRYARKIPPGEAG